MVAIASCESAAQYCASVVAAPDVVGRQQNSLTSVKTVVGQIQRKAGGIRLERYSDGIGHHS